MKLDRRTWLSGSVALAACARAGIPPTERTAAPSYRERLAALERETGGRLGVAAWDMEQNSRIAYRENERFLMCSTFKFPLAGAVLQRVDAGRERLDRRIAYDASVLLDNSPVTAKKVPEGSLSVAQLCEATITVSDNAAANLLLSSIGGPPALTRFFRSLGDDVSRLDRIEPELNTSEPGDERDTTSAAAMLHTAHMLLVSEQALRPDSRRLLGDWLTSASTGLERLRSAFPPQLRAGDKTGTGEDGVTNDVAIVWRTSRKPLLVAAYSFGLPGDLHARSAVIGRVGRIVVEALGVA